MVVMVLLTLCHKPDHQAGIVWKYVISDFQVLGIVVVKKEITCCQIDEKNENTFCQSAFHQAGIEENTETREFQAFGIVSVNSVQIFPHTPTRKSFTTEKMALTPS